MNVNLEMVKRDFAWAYKQYLKRPYASEYIEAENEARAKRLGLWQQANPQPHGSSGGPQRESNAENLLIIRSKQLAQKYIDYVELPVM